VTTSEWFIFQGTDDVLILAPPPPNPTSSATTDDQPIGEDLETAPANSMSVSEIVGVSGRMIDSVHDFGAADMPVEGNEEFTPHSDGMCLVASKIKNNKIMVKTRA